MELALQTAMAAVRAESGRLTMREGPDSRLAEVACAGSLDGIESVIHDAERDALREGRIGKADGHEAHVAGVPLLPAERGERIHGLITVAVKGRSFSEHDHELLRSLVSQASLAFENVELHHQIQRQAVTDELTGLSNHGRFQKLLSNELEQVCRYSYPVGLIMLDIDDFKAVNDSYGHQQGDVVLRQVARVVLESSRKTTRNGLAGALWRRGDGRDPSPHGPRGLLRHRRARPEAIEALRIRRLDGDGVLTITASLGVVSSSEGDKHGLVAAADRALYEAKRRPKNQTRRGSAQTANVFSGE
ncbi:MAG: sensor domain-containing diguanylate cyclase [Candidatus Limnocylindrales bacterium]